MTHSNGFDSYVFFNEKEIVDTLAFCLSNCQTNFLCFPGINLRVKAVFAMFESFASDHHHGIFIAMKLWMKPKTGSCITKKDKNYPNTRVDWFICWPQNAEKFCRIFLKYFLFTLITITCAIAGLIKPGKLIKLILLRCSIHNLIVGLVMYISDWLDWKNVVIVSWLYLQSETCDIPFFCKLPAISSVLYDLHDCYDK